MNYECHITIPASHSLNGERVAAGWKGWKTSEIARDPLLGNDTYFYLTHHSSSLTLMTSAMDRVVHELKQLGVPVLRTKIELILHDSKTGLTL